MTPTFPRDGVSGHAGAIHNFAQVASELLTVCGIDPADFWKADTLKLVGDLQAETPFYDDLKKKFDDARQKIDGKTITPPTKGDLAQTGKVEDEHGIWNTHWKMVPCPVSGSAAKLSGSERFFTHQTDEDAFRTTILADPEELSCDVCKLSLKGRELKQVQLDRYWEVEAQGSGRGW